MSAPTKYVQAAIEEIQAHGWTVIQTGRYYCVERFNTVFLRDGTAADICAFAQGMRALLHAHREGWAVPL